MLVAAATAIANLTERQGISARHIIPSVFDEDVSTVVANAVGGTATVTAPPPQRHPSRDGVRVALDT
jgi:malic enzyme